MTKSILNYPCYLVGGAVRDRLLGHETSDRDFVVVGATPEEMLAAGFKSVGRDFPVFLHPDTGEEYALARTERKSGRGYHGFIFYSSPSVTLREDLSRRDLTINAIAMDADGKLIDYYDGQRDLRAKILRHVSSAFVEDPVRLLRVARLRAMLPDFTLADETQTLLCEMVANGEVAHLQAERVWRELARGLAAAKPSRMIETLANCGALAVLLPEVEALRGVPERLDYHPEGESFIHTMMVIDTLAARGGTAAECWAALLHDIGKAKTPPEILPSHHGHEKHSARLAQALCDRLRVPRAEAQLAVLAAAEHGNIHKSHEMRAGKVIDLLTRLDAFRRRCRFESVLRMCEADFYYLPERKDEIYRQGEFIRTAYTAAAAVATGDIAADVMEKAGANGASGAKIAEAVRAARIKAVISCVRGRAQ